MATKDERPGLLSKVAMFVRNPTMDWSELDKPEQEKEAAYDKHALKAMIERKRQNDFVRKREFDRLRKLRSRDPASPAAQSAASMFQNSVGGDMDGRATTLKKIDEIEAQMSRQWWKSRQGSASQPAPASPSTPPAEAGPPVAGATGTPVALPRAVPRLDPDSEAEAEAQPSSPAFEATEPLNMGGDSRSGDSSDFASTIMASGMMSGAADAEPEAVDSHIGLGLDELDFSAAGAGVHGADEMATDPELEEAAILFANGDDASAEAVLLGCLRGHDLEPEAARSWAAALLDLYRATNQRLAFESAAKEFSLHLFGAKPVWMALAARPVEQAGEASENTPGWTWVCPAELDEAGMEQLRSSLRPPEAQPAGDSPQAAPWRLDWSRLARITPQAMPLLDSLFSSLCEAVVHLRFAGGDRLAAVLRGMTPSGDRRVPALWWQVRLNALRAMHLRDDFELAALDFCVTLELPLTSWATPRCHYVAEALAAPPPMAGLARIGGVQGTQGAEVLSLEGEISGDASQILAALDRMEPDGARLVVQCEHLLRVDFAAAGSIHNWVNRRHEEGCLIHFAGVHRVVAAFFNVVGINELARVVPRPV
jgi:anti-anti-sigma regulatory factor